MCENSASATAAAKPPARAPPGDETLSPDEDASSSDRAARRDGARGTLGGGVRRAPTTARGVPKPGAVPGARGSAPAGPRDAAAPPSSSSPLATAARLTAAAASVAATTAAVAGVNLPILRHISPEDEEGYVPFVVHGGGALTSELLARCPTLYRPYKLPRWCTNAHAQTLIGYARMLTLFLKYDRQLVRTEDGGQVGLDWLVRARFGRPAPAPGLVAGVRGRPRPPDADEGVAASSIPDASTLPPDAPVFIMLHGINGGSHEGPTKWAIATGAARGWRCVALNLRGCNGVKLASPKVYCAASSSDVRAAVNACRALYPNAPVLLAGYSLGTYVIGTYLAEEDSKPGGAAEKGVAGAVLVSCPLDPHSSHAGLSDPSRPAGLLYNGAIAAELRRYFYKYQTQVTEHPEVDEDALNIAEMRTIRDFEKALIVVTHGFKDIDEYYDYFSPARIIPSIRTPTLYLIARDDPFVGEREQCEHAIRQSKHVALAHVEKGGHVAFLERGVGVFGQFWTDRVLGEFLGSTLERRSEAAEAAAVEAGQPELRVAREPAAKGRVVARTSQAEVPGEEEEDGEGGGNLNPRARL